MHVVVKPIDVDVVSSNDNIEVPGENDDSGCEYCPTDLMCLSVATRNHAVDKNEGGDGACCSMDSAYLI